MFTLRQLHEALVLAEHLNFRKAAAALKISQPSLSRSIALLEEELGAKLFNRTRGYVKITASGQLFVEEARKLVDSAENLRTALFRKANGTEEEIHVAVGEIVAQTWISSALREFASSHPKVRVEIHEMNWWELRDAVRAESFDLVIGECSEAMVERDIATHALPNRRGVFIVRAGHPLTQQAVKSMADMAAFPYVGLRLPARAVSNLPQNCPMGFKSEDGRYFIPRIECARLTSMLDVVEGSEAFCLSIPQIFARGLEDGRLAVIDFSPSWLHTNYAIMHLRERKLSRLAKAFKKAAITAERAYFSKG